MALKYGFFDSATGDEREYVAQDFADVFALFFTNGVKSGDMAVTAGTGLDVNVAAGFVHINGYHVENDAILNLEIGANVSGLPRIDRVVVRLDLATRTFDVDVIAGTPASSPTAPALTRTGTTYEISLAQVRVNNGASTVTVTDERGNTSVCGYVNDLGVNITSGTAEPGTLAVGDIYIRYS